MYLFSLNRNENFDENEKIFIQEHIDEFRGLRPIKTTILYLMGTYPHGGEFFVSSDFGKILIPCKTGRSITWDGNVKHGARIFYNKTRLSVAFSQFIKR